MRSREQLLADVHHVMTYYGLDRMETVAAEIDYNPRSLERVLYRYGEGELVRKLLPGRRSMEEIKAEADLNIRQKNQRARRRQRAAALANGG